MPRQRDIAENSGLAALDREDAAGFFREVLGGSDPSETSGKGSRPGLTIAQLVERFGLSARALRFYEEKNLLSPGRHRGARLYGPDDLKRLKLILMGKRVGFSLADIRQVLSLYDRSSSPTQLISFVMTKFDEQAEFLEEQEAEIRLAHSELRHVRAVASDMLKQRRAATTRPASSRARGRSGSAAKLSIQAGGRREAKRS